MNENNIKDNMTDPSEGYDGEAMEKTPVKGDEESGSHLEKPTDTGWFVAMVRCNCEKKIATAMEVYCRNRDIWFEPWVPMMKVVYIDRRTGKRRTMEKSIIPTCVFCHISKRKLNEIRFLMVNYMLTAGCFRSLNAQTLVHKGCGRTTTGRVK